MPILEAKRSCLMVGGGSLLEVADAMRISNL